MPDSILPSLPLGKDTESRFSLCFVGASGKALVGLALTAFCCLKDGAPFSRTSCLGNNGSLKRSHTMSVEVSFVFLQTTLSQENTQRDDQNVKGRN